MIYDQNADVSDDKTLVPELILTCLEFHGNSFVICAFEIIWTFCKFSRSALQKFNEPLRQF